MKTATFEFSRKTQILKTDLQKHPVYQMYKPFKDEIREEFVKIGRDLGIKEGVPMEDPLALYSSILTWTALEKGNPSQNAMIFAMFALFMLDNPEMFAATSEGFDRMMNPICEHILAT